MRILGWMASAVGVVGVGVCNGLVPLLWVLRASLRARAGGLLAVPDAGLEAAISLTGDVASWLGDASGGIDDIRAKADALARAPVVDAPAAVDLATAIDEFISGPYATLRTVYAGLRERALAVGDALTGIGKAVPVLAIAGAVADRLQAIDARMQEIDASVASLGRLGPAGLAEPGVAGTVSEQAAVAAERLQAIGESLTEVEAWLNASRDRVVEADRRASRALTVGAVVGTALTLFVAGLNVLLFQQGRRWSRR
jgi:hypothetical protein